MSATTQSADSACPAGLEDVWADLVAHSARLRHFSLNEANAADPARARRLQVAACGITLNYARALLDEPVLGPLHQLAASAGLADARAALFGGERINRTEGRAAMHMALRAQRGDRFQAAGKDVVSDVLAVRERMQSFADALHADGRITDVVSIGIGGSDLGPRMVCAALTPWHRPGIRVHFVANVDPDDLGRTLAGLTPASTLFVVTSKTFTTAETMANARAARRWLTDALGEAAVASHFVAASTNRSAVTGFGIDPQNMFEFWDWVGGRYSLWSAVGLPILLQLGSEAWQALLQGAADMDRHFQDAPASENLPVTLGLLGIWYRNFLDRPAQVVVPYAQRLAYFVPWLQQLEMESNGKSVSRANKPVDWATSPQVWGDVGTNAQHAFFQLLHQGSDWSPVDFVLPLAGAGDDDQRQQMLVANCLAQSAALMQGHSEAEVREELDRRGLADDELEALLPHRVLPGNRPSNMLLLPRLDPCHLGALLALYEHKVFVQGVIWEVYSFDQWGVELGKQLAGDILPALQSGELPQGLDAVSRALIGQIRGKE